MRGSPAARRGGAFGAGGARFARAGGGFAAGGAYGAVLGVLGLLCVLCVTGVPGRLVAQVATTGEVLTFEGAVGVALGNSPVLLRRVNAVAAAEYGARQSVGALLPGLSASVGRDWQSVGGDVDLLSLENVRGWGAARARLEAAEARVGLEAARLRTLVGVAYYDVVQREQLVVVEERTLGTARDQLAAIRALMRVAARQPTDVLGAELDVARAEQVLRQAVGAARKARLSLRQRMGVPMEARFDVVSAFLPVFDPAALDAVSLMDRARVESPALAEQRATVEAADRSLSAAGASRYPTISGSYGYSRGRGVRDYDALGQLELPGTRWSFGVGLRVPLFDRFRTSAAIGRARVDADDARQTLREARLALERDVRAALIDLEIAYAGVRLAERSADTARERLRQGQAQYRQGRLQDYTALQQMIDAVARQERTVTRAYYDFSVARLTLEEKVGGPLDVAAAAGARGPAHR